MDTDQDSVAAPYVGPRPFERNEAHLFFGREQEAEILISLTISQRLVVLYSASGLGKSSLLRAKAIPSLQDYGFTVLGPYRISQHQGPSLAGLIALDQGIAGSSLLNVLERLSINAAPSGGAPKDAPTERIPTFVIVLDQFEEIFAEGNVSQYSRFFQELRECLDACAPPQSSAARPGPLFDKCRLRIVIAMREDHIAKLEPFFNILPELREVRFRLEPLSRASAIEAVTGPVEAFRSESGPIRYGPGVADEIVSQLLKTRTIDGTLVESHGVEPVQLQVVCLDLWNALPSTVEIIELKHIPKGWDVDSVLRAFYDRALEACSQYGAFRWSILARAYGKARLRKWFREKLITPGGTRGTVFREKDRTGGIPNAIVDRLVEHYLIRHERRAGGDWYEISHDRMVPPIIESNRRWNERLYQIIAAASAAVVALFIIGYAGERAVEAISATNRVKSEDVLESVHRADLSAPDLRVAIAAVVSDKPTVWDLPPSNATELLRSAIFERPEISIFGRAEAAVTAMEKDVDGRPYVITAARRAHALSLSGTRVELENKELPPGCLEESMKLVATNGEVYLVARKQALRICDGSSQWEYDIAAENSESLAAALHPLGRYFAYASCAAPCPVANISVVDISKKAQISRWTLDADGQSIRDVTALTFGPGMIGVAGCIARSPGTEHRECAESVVKVFDWDGKMLHEWSVDSPKIRAIALSNHWVAFAHDNPRLGIEKEPGESRSGRIQLKRVRTYAAEGRFRPPDDDRNWDSVGGASDALTFGDGEHILISGNALGLLTVRRVENVPFQGAIVDDGIQEQSNCAVDSRCAKLSAGQALASARATHEFVSSYSTYSGRREIDGSGPLLPECLRLWTLDKAISSPDWECRKAPKSFDSWSWRSVGVSNDGMVVAGVGLDVGRAWVRDRRESFKPIPEEHAQYASSTAVSADGRKIAWGRETGRVEIWSLQDGKVVHTWWIKPPLPYDCVRPRIPGPFYFRVTALAFAGVSEDQTLVVADGDGCIAAYSILPDDTAKPLWRQGANNSILTVSLDQRGSWLAAGTVNGNILVWDLNSIGSEPSAIIRAHLPWVASIVWLRADKDGSMILAANARWGPIGLWQVTRAKEPETRTVVEELVRAIWLAGRGTAALAGNENGLVALNVDGRLLEIRPYLNADEAKTDMVQLACNRAATAALEASEAVWSSVLVGTAAKKRTDMKTEFKRICDGLLTTALTDKEVGLR
jgi:hypothetical protein